MTENDRLNARKGKKRNEIESFIYEKKNQLEEEKKNVSVKLDEVDNWLHEVGEETTLEDLSKKLDDLKVQISFFLSLNVG
jgi:ribosomal protein L25 (general stress protein Ctc)